MDVMRLAQRARDQELRLIQCLEDLEGSAFDQAKQALALFQEENQELLDF